MDWSQHSDPLARREDMTPSETARANAALRDYAHMGVGRDIRSLHARYAEQAKWWKEQRAKAKGEGEIGHGVGEPLAEKPPTAVLSTMWMWSTTYEWVERVRRYDAIQAEKEQTAYEERRLKIRKTRQDMTEGMLGLAGNVLVLQQKHKMNPRRVTDPQTGEVIEYPPAVVSEMTMNAAMRVAAEVSDLARREFGDDVEQVDVTSGGKPIPITEIQVHLKE